MVSGDVRDVEETEEPSSFAPISMRFGLVLASSIFFGYLLVCGYLALPETRASFGSIRTPPVQLVLAGWTVFIIAATYLLTSIFPSGGSEEDLKQGTTERSQGRIPEESAESAAGSIQAPGEATAGRAKVMILPGPRITWASIREREVGEKASGPLCALCGRALHRPQTCRHCGLHFCSRHFSAKQHDCPESVRDRSRERDVLLLLLASIIATSTFMISLPVQPRLLMMRAYSLEGTQTGTSVVETHDGGFLIAARHTPPEQATTDQTTAGPANDTYIMRIDPDGELIWQRAFDLGQVIRPRIVMGEAGEYVLLGAELVTDSTHGFALLKIDDGGAIIWRRDLFAEENIRPHCIARAGDDGYLIVGETSQSDDIDLDVFVWKVNGTGNVIWKRTYGGEESEYGSWIERCDGGGFVVAGATNSSNMGRFSIYLLRIDDDGNALWESTPGSNFPNYGLFTFAVTNVLPTREGGFLVSCATDAMKGEEAPSEFKGMSDCYMVKVDGNGKLQWELVHRTDARDVVLAGVENDEGTMVVAGYRRTYKWMQSNVSDPTNPNSRWALGRDSAYFLKLEADGAVAWEKAYRREKEMRVEHMIRASNGDLVATGRLVGGFEAVSDSKVVLLRVRDEEWRRVPIYTPIVVVVVLSAVWVFLRRPRRKSRTGR